MIMVMMMMMMMMMVPNRAAVRRAPSAQEQRKCVRRAGEPDTTQTRWKSKRRAAARELQSVAHAIHDRRAYGRGLEGGRPRRGAASRTKCGQEGQRRTWMRTSEFQVPERIKHARAAVAVALQTAVRPHHCNYRRNCAVHRRRARSRARRRRSPCLIDLEPNHVYTKLHTFHRRRLTARN